MTAGRFLRWAIAAAVLGVGIHPSLRAAGGQVPFLFHVQGDVSYRQTADRPWAKAARDTLLKEGGEIKTEQDASCEIAFAPGALNVVKIRASSKARLESIEPAVLRIEEGGLYSLLDDLQPGNSFRVVSPAATVTAHGTGRSQTAAGAFACFAGSIDIKTPSGSGLVLKEDTAAEVSGDGFSGPGPIGGEVSQGWRDWIRELAPRRDIIASIWNVFDRFGGEFVNVLGGRERAVDQREVVIRSSGGGVGGGGGGGGGSGGGGGGPTGP